MQQLYNNNNNNNNKQKTLKCDVGLTIDRDVAEKRMITRSLGYKIIKL